jgi:transcriptional regulator with XRE-family HTH domain
MDTVCIYRGFSSNMLGDFLHYWRRLRGMFQLSLAMDAGISQRHMSVIEGGRSKPGRQTL